METSIENIPQKELTNIQTWLEQQDWLTEKEINDKGLVLILYKFYQMEQRLTRIEFNQKTHWA